MSLIGRIASGSTLLVFATVLGVATAGAAFAWLNEQGRSAEPLVEDPALVVVAREAVPAGTLLPISVLQLREVPRGHAASGALDHVEAAAGRVTRYPLVQGEQVVESKLVARGGQTGSGLAFTVPPGMRAVSVPVSETNGAGGLIIPGDRVDVLVSTEYGRLFSPSEPGDRKEVERTPTVLTVLQDVVVLAVGQELARPADDGQDKATARVDEADVQPKARSVTLAVLPSSAQVLVMAAEHGRLALALRPFGDESQAANVPLLKLEPAAPGGDAALAAR